MSKKEIALMRKRNAEEAQSMSDSLGSSVPVSHHEGRSQLLCADSADQDSSASPSSDLSQAHASQVPSTGPLTPPTTHTSTSPFPPEGILSSPAVHGVDQGSTVLQTSPASREFPKFPRLSSPDASPIACLPCSPDLNMLSLRPNLAAQNDAFDRRHSRLVEVTQGDRPQSLRHSQSQSSSLSQESVERQLTQEQDDLMDISVRMKKSDVVQNSATEGAALSTSKLEDPASMISSIIADADADLQWPESEPELIPANQPRQLSPPVGGENAEDVKYRSSPVVLRSGRGRHFRSGTLHISPLPQRTTPWSTPQSSQKNIHSPQVSQEAPNSGVSQSSAHSYPLVLQTQAPYQSQSYDLSLSQA
ncbi:hypothetical protein AZE42_00475 [Rhizopogon vesiculosus]|uniref:Uncharacterized protein n=1 Tax=Rhizopogon vesiculosus TaxID=180088 RepID=A0A1J8QJS1_9AGAM|nr:hypothetical protein AZE42_00475 [Rhizopogon vesiculosus]